MAKVIGIDLGTNKFCMAVFQNDKIEIIPNDIGERTTPSCVAFTDKENLVGDTAKNQMHRNASNTLFSIKRLIGRKFEDKDIQNLKDNMVHTFKPFDSQLVNFTIFISESSIYFYYDIFHSNLDGNSINIFESNLELAYLGKPLPKDYYFLMGE